jgi:methionine-rich copper-binding protein CopC
VALAVAVAGAGVILAAAPARAHNSLTASTPGDGAVLDEAPDAVVLEFLSTVDPDTTEVLIVGPDGEPAMDGPARYDGRTVAVPLAAAVAGRYVVEYTVLADDGHLGTNEITFRLTDAAVPAPSPGPSPSPSATPPSPSPAPPDLGAATAGPVERAASAAGGAAWWPWAAGAVVLAAALGGAVFAWRRRRAPPAG